jgi:prepilin-type N-terminal cleavage/methylation domain-containing protein
MARPRNGLTLIEMMIALFLVAIAFSALVAVFPAVYRHSAQSRNRFLAQQAGRNVIETLRAVPWGKPAPAFARQDHVFDQVVEGERHFLRFKVKEIKFEPANATGDGPDPRSPVSQVRVTLEWREGTGSSSASRRQTLCAAGSLTKF